MNLATPYLNYDAENAEKQQCEETNMKGTTIRGHTPTNLRNTVSRSSAVPEDFPYQRFFFICRFFIIEALRRQHFGGLFNVGVFLCGVSHSLQAPFQ